MGLFSFFPTLIPRYWIDCEICHALAKYIKVFNNVWYIIIIIIIIYFFRILQLLIRWWISFFALVRDSDAQNEREGNSSGQRDYAIIHATKYSENERNFQPFSAIEGDGLKLGARGWIEMYVCACNGQWWMWRWWHGVCVCRCEDEEVGIYSLS